MLAINRCILDNGFCEGFCQYLGPGLKKCVCLDSYSRLNADGRTCSCIAGYSKAGDFCQRMLFFYGRSSNVHISHLCANSYG
jgi:hypothetical protein